MRTLHKNGTVGTLAGDGQNRYLDSSDPLRASFSTMYQMYVDRYSTIYVADYGSNRTRLIYRNSTVAAVPINIHWT